jgi:ribonuclease R
VVPFGLFVALDDVFIEGLVHISELGADYFHYEEGKHRLVGERSGRMYRLADRVRIQVVRVDLDNTRIDFRLADGGGDFGRVPRKGPAAGDGPPARTQEKKGGGRPAAEPQAPARRSKEAPGKAPAAGRKGKAVVSGHPAAEQPRSKAAKPGKSSGVAKPKTAKPKPAKAAAKPAAKTAAKGSGRKSTGKPPKSAIPKKGGRK